MALLTHRIVAAAMAGLLLAASASAEEVTAIATSGKGDLTMCPYMGCNLYHHIKVPQQIAVGDHVTLHFGSNPKRYSFPVARIVKEGATCTIYSQTKDTEGVEKIEIAACHPPPSAAE